MNRQRKGKQFEQYKRLVKFLGSVIIVAVELILYYYVWMNHNRNMTIAFWRRGNWLIIGEYLALLLLLHRMYGDLYRHL